MGALASEETNSYDESMPNFQQRSRPCWSPAAPQHRPPDLPKRYWSSVWSSLTDATAFNLPGLFGHWLRLTYHVTVCYFLSVIVSYRDKRTRNFASGKRVKAFSGFERSARLKLDRLEAAVELRDLSALPGNRFEALKGDRKGQYSIRVNDQWRICFEWPAGASGPLNVEIVDYH